MAEYAFLTAWRVAAPRNAVFEVLHESERWPEWWNGVESVEWFFVALGFLFDVAAHSQSGRLGRGRR